MLLNICYIHNICTHIIYGAHTQGYMVGIMLLNMRQFNTPFLITARHTVTKAELLSWDFGYTLFNNKTPHSDQS